MPAVNHNKYRLSDYPQWRVCHVFRRVILRWSMSQAGATVNPPEAFQHSSFHHTFVGSFLMDLWLFEVSFPFRRAQFTSPSLWVQKSHLHISTLCICFAVYLLEFDWHKLIAQSHVKRRLRAGLEAFICSADKPQAVINSLQWLMTVCKVWNGSEACSFLTYVCCLDYSMTAVCLV